MYGGFYEMESMSYFFSSWVNRLSRGGTHDEIRVSCEAALYKIASAILFEVINRHLAAGAPRDIQARFLFGDGCNDELL